VQSLASSVIDEDSFAPTAAWPIDDSAHACLSLSGSAPLIWSMSAIAATASTLSFFAALAVSRAAQREGVDWGGRLYEVPLPLLEAGRIEAAIIAAALPAPVSGPVNAASAWMGKATRVLSELRRHDVPRTRKINPRCSAFFTTISMEALVADAAAAPQGWRGSLGEGIGLVLSRLSRVEQIVLADNLAADFVVLPHDAPLSWWSSAIATARADIRAGNRAACVASVLLVACAA